MPVVAERRFVVADLEIRSDGRTVHGLAVPYDVESEVSDGGPRYREVFRRGVFARSISERGGRVKLFTQHEHSKLPIGRATSLVEDARGLVGEFRVSNTRDGDEALELVTDGALDGLSVGFRPIRNRTATRGLVERVEAALAEVSLVAFPAYPGARIEGVRSEQPTEPLPVDLARRRLDLHRKTTP